MAFDARASVFAGLPPTLLGLLLAINLLGGQRPPAQVPEPSTMTTTAGRSDTTRPNRQRQAASADGAKPAPTPTLRQRAESSVAWTTVVPYLSRSRCLPPATSRCTLDVVIVTIADARHSSAQWQADRQLYTLQAAAGAAGYSLERYSLADPPVPSKDGKSRQSDGAADSGGDAHLPPSPRQPGVLLFRAELDEQQAGSGGTVPAGTRLLLLLLVPEMPTSGVEPDAFLVAAYIAATLQRVPASTAAPPWLRVLGPTYSGSARSLRLAIEDAEARICVAKAGESASTPHLPACLGRVPGSRLPVRVVSGSATSEGIESRIAGSTAARLDITFARTVHDNRALLRALREQLAHMNPDWRKGENMALLVEANTGWGADLQPQERPGTEPTPNVVRELFEEALILTFPLHIAQAERPRPEHEPGLPSYARGLAPNQRLTLADQATPQDRLPLYSPDLSESARDIALHAVLHQLERGRKNVVGILATDIRDHLFLAREINRLTPNVQLFGTEPDVLLLHPQYLPYNRGSLWASSFPLQPHMQRVTSHKRPRVQFTAMSQQGLFNALEILLERPQLRMDAEPPEFSGGKRTGAPATPWVLAVGQHGFVPIQTSPSVSDRSAAPGPTAAHYVFATRYEKGMWAAVPLVAIVCLLCVAAAQVRALPALPWLSPPQLNGLLPQGQPLALLASVSRALWPAGTGDSGRTRGIAFALELEHVMLRLACAVGVLLVAHVLWVLLSLVYGASLWWLTPALSAGFHVTRTVLVVLTVVALAHAVRRVRSGAASRLWARRAPDALAAVGLVMALVFVVRVHGYLNDLATQPLATRVLTVDRFFALDSLLSPLVQLGALLALLLVWVTWSLRTLYYQCIPLPAAGRLVRHLVGYDCPDARLTRQIVSTLHTTIQPSGWYAIVGLSGVSAYCLLAAPRTYTLEGAAFRSVLLSGTMLAILAIALELGQAAWLAVRVKRLLERIRIHPVAPALTALKDSPVDWRPALLQPQSPHRLLMRLLHEHCPPVQERARRVPILRTAAWQDALWAAASIAHAVRTRRRLVGRRDEALLALVTATFVHTLVTRVVRGFGIAVVMTLILLVGHLATTFPGRSVALLVDVALLSAAALLSIRVLLSFERDYILSTLWKGTPGALNLDSGLVWRAVLYAGLPLVTIISALFPEVGGGALTVLEPLRQLLPAQ